MAMEVVENLTLLDDNGPLFVPPWDHIEPRNGIAIVGHKEELE